MGVPSLGVPINSITFFGKCMANLWTYDMYGWSFLNISWVSCKPGGYIRKNRKILDDVWGTICNWLVVSTPLKIMTVNRKDYPIYYGKNKKCSKPPTRHALCWWKGDVVILRSKYGHWHSTGEWYGPRIDTSSVVGGRPGVNYQIRIHGGTPTLPCMPFR
jgi:hypothetical protein